MFGIGFFEIIVILFIALIFIKPKDLPDLIRKIGKIYSEIRNAYFAFLRMINSFSDDLESMIQLDSKPQTKDKKNSKKVIKKNDIKTLKTKKEIKVVKKLTKNNKKRGKK